MGFFRSALLYACLALTAFPVCLSAADERAAAADFFGEAAARDAAERYLQERGIPFQRRSLLADYGGFGVSVHVDLSGPAENRAAGTLVVAAPLSSTRGPAGLEIAFGVRAALAFASRVAAEGAPLDVRVALLADEYSQLPEDLRGGTLLGLRDLADRYAESERTAVIYLDLRESRGGFNLVHGSPFTVAPLGVLKPFMAAFDAAGLPLPFAVPFNELYRLGLVRGSEALPFLQDRGFPALLVREGSRPGVAAASDPERFADGLFRYAAALRAVPEAADRRYFLFTVGERVIPLPEGLSVALFALTAALGMASLLGYSLTHRHLLIARGRVFLRRAWVLPLFLAILFVCVLAADYCLSFVLSLFGASDGKPRYGEAALKFALALAFYSIASPLLRRRSIPKRAHFYGSAACILLAALSFAAAIIDFTFVPLFLWAFALALAAASIRDSSVGFFLAGLSLLQILAAAAAAVGSGEAGPARILLADDPAHNLFFAFVILPFHLLFRRAACLARSRSGSSLAARAFYSRILFFSGTILAILSYASDTAKAEGRTVPPVRERIEASGDPRGTLRLDLASSTFLDRRTVRISLRSADTPVRLDLSFESDEPVSVYDAPVPYALSEDGRRATLLLGERPPMPLDLELTLPLSAEGRLRASAIYSRPGNAESPDGGGDALIVDASAAIGGEK